MPDITQSTKLPYSLDILSDYLPNVTPPEGSFDPTGDWDHRYTMWIALRGIHGKSHKGGALRIRRSATSSGGAELAISQVTGPMGGGGRISHTTAQAICDTDRLTTPRKWRIENRLVDPNGRQVDLTQARISGESKSGQVALRGRKTDTLKMPGPFTSSWSLFDAVQRLPFDAQPIRFDMLEDLDLPKPGQRLAPGPSVELTLGARSVRLHSFEQTGYGILPYTYWLDDAHRLLMAVGGVRTFIWDPTAKLPEDAI